MLGIIRTNAIQTDDISLKDRGIIAHVVCPIVSYMSHSCISNARCRYVVSLIMPCLLIYYHLIFPKSMSPGNHHIKVWSKTKIMKGEEITIQYVSSMSDHLTRRKHIKSNWYFECQCPRCLDPSELGAYA